MRQVEILGGSGRARNSVAAKMQRVGQGFRLYTPTCCHMLCVAALHVVLKPVEVLAAALDGHGLRSIPAQLPTLTSVRKWNYCESIQSCIALT
jgi:hypothetical protein